MMVERIFLIGLMGAGKTAVGENLAKRLNWLWIDLDALIVQKNGLSIQAIFEQYGESYFRRLEKEALAEVVPLKNVVVSTGGGVILDDENRQVLTQSGVCIYLAAKLSTLTNRLRGSEDRPLLKRHSLEQLIGEREPLYTAVAHQVVETDDLTVEAVVDILIKGI